MLIKKKNPHITEAFIRLENAGCFHRHLGVSAIVELNKRTGIHAMTLPTIKEENQYAIEKQRTLNLPFENTFVRGTMCALPSNLCLLYRRVTC